MKCQNCLCVSYCGRACQLKDWKKPTGNHKAACPRLAKETYDLVIDQLEQERGSEELWVEWLIGL